MAEQRHRGAAVHVSEGRVHVWGWGLWIPGQTIINPNAVCSNPKETKTHTRRGGGLALTLTLDALEPCSSCQRWP